MGDGSKETVNDNLAATITIVLIFGTIIFFATYYFFRLTILASLSLSLMVGYVLLNLMYPFGSLMYQRSSMVIVIYLFIIIFVPIYLLLYLFVILLQTRRPLPPLPVDTEKND